MAARLFVITGGPGSGKTAIIDELAKRGYATTDEVGRRIIREEMATDSTGLPWKDRIRFAELMLAAETQNHKTASSRHGRIFCDRGVPDIVGYLRLENLPISPEALRAARERRYEPLVFICPPWPEIFIADAERRQTPDVAERTCAMMRQTYGDYGYDLIEVPRAPVPERVAFLLDKTSD